MSECIRLGFNIILEYRRFGDDGDNRVSVLGKWRLAAPLVLTFREFLRAGSEVRQDRK